MWNRRCLVSPLLVTLLLSAVSARAEDLSASQLTQLLQSIDALTTHRIDYEARFFLEEKSKGKNDLVYDGVVYRRDARDALIILFLQPKARRGEGYLRIDKNLWFYDPRIGKWERRTERERIGGTSSRRQDFDKSTLARDYNAVFAGAVKLGKYKAWKVALSAKSGADVAYPKVTLWIDQDSKNILKREESAASGKLLRTSYFPKWIEADVGGRKVRYPQQIRIFDELVKGNTTTVVIRSAVAKPQPANMFTKAWFEAQSR